LYQSIILCL